MGSHWGLHQTHPRPHSLTSGRPSPYSCNVTYCAHADGYWVEILPRTSKPEALAAIPPQPASWPVIAGKPAFQQTMYRIKDPKASVPFYQKHFGMSLICERYFPEAKFSLYFMGEQSCIGCLLQLEAVGSRRSNIRHASVYKLC